MGSTKEAGKDLTKESNAEGRMEERLLPEGLPRAGGKGAGWRACELKPGSGWEVTWVGLEIEERWNKKAKLMQAFIRNTKSA